MEIIVAIFGMIIAVAIVSVSNSVIALNNTLDEILTHLKKR